MIGIRCVVLIFGSLSQVFDHQNHNAFVHSGVQQQHVCPFHFWSSGWGSEACFSHALAPKNGLSINHRSGRRS